MKTGICAIVGFVGEAVRYQSEGQLTSATAVIYFGAAAALNQDWKTSQNKHRKTSSVEDVPLSVRSAD